MSEGKQQFKGKNKRRGGWEIISVYVCMALFFVVVLPLMGSFFLLSMDKFHVFYRDIVIDYGLKQDNYYDGEIWVSVAATLIGAVVSAAPGLACGILALIQTKRLHNLEARYHRPVLDVERVGLTFVKLSHFRNEEGNLCIDVPDSRQRNGVYEADKQSSAWWIDLEVVLFSNSGITTKDMEIESVTVVFPKAGPDKVYKLCLLEPDRNLVEIRGFKRGIRDGHTVYTLPWSLYPCQMKPQASKSDFERCISEFVFYSSEGCNPRYSCMELAIEMNVDYEYGEGEKTRGLLKVLFDAGCSESLEQSPSVINNMSDNGYFTYEV